MRIVLYIGAFLLCVTFGASVSMIILRSTPTTIPVPPAGGAITRTVAGVSVRVPLPPGFCALDPSNAADRATQARTVALGNTQWAENIVMALPCERRAEIDRTLLAPGMRVMMFGAMKPDGRTVERVSIPRAAFLTRLRDRTSALGVDGVGRTDAASGTSTTLRGAGEDASAHYFRMTAGNARLTPFEACGVMAMTLASRIAVMLTLIENCSTAAVDDDMLPEAGQLAARIVALNP